ncbi:cyclic peptide export ABC transporter [Arenibaculum pallidiluteum]|uniref:cyclic peptide export ABC transporter n=1 Tax=Arenibaculum pallidiluteum TaxID=2812559 RepID=UPI001A975909|nr:cyclic peptide export ABC transporter [Arenibaculum pallidiluteum]
MPPLLELLSRHLARHRRSLAVMAFLAGLSNTLVLATINAATGVVGDRDATLRFAVMFAIAIVLFVLVQQKLMRRVATDVERTIEDYRVALFAAVRKTSLPSIEGINRAELFACISRETRVLSQATPAIVVAGQSAVLVLCTLVYMAWLSMTAFIMWSACTVVGAMVHYGRSKEIRTRLAEAYRKENQLVTRTNDLVDGFKEVKMNRLRGSELERDFTALATEVAEHRVTTQMLHSRHFALSQVMFFILAGLMVFVVPILSPTFVDVVVMTTTASLFLIGPLSSVVSVLPTVANVNAAASAILSLRRRLAAMDAEAASDQEPFREFRTLRLEWLLYQHRDATGEGGFTVGPITVTIERGQTVFITGGNGSGKTTLIRLLTGLYSPDRGTIWLDGNVIDASNLPAYRDLFSAVFSDNHLFTELYGIEEIDQAYADRLFEILEIGHKAQIRDRRFTNVMLSGGQRKRLALIAALLERRPVCIFDEWAADQDPYFREKFYRVVLPMLKDAGVTVIAITHDDRFFDIADMHLHMEDGRLHVVRAAPSGAVSADAGPPALAPVEAA